jgi:hypothetical protein
MLLELCGYIIVTCVFFGFVLWIAEETKIGRKLTNWLYKKFMK